MMTYTVCVRTIVSVNEEPAFTPGFLEEPYDHIRKAAERADYFLQCLGPANHRPCPCKTALFGALHEEFGDWAAETYIEKEDKAHHRTVGVSICFDDLDQAVEDGIPAEFIRVLGEKESPRYEFFCPLNGATDHPIVQQIVQKMGYTAQADDRRDALKKLAKEKTPAPKLDAYSHSR